WDLVLRKIAHLLEFAILCVLLFRAIESSGKKNKFWPVFLSFTYAITDEIHQYYIPGRYTSLIDVLIDTAGSIAGLWVYRGGKQRVADSR
ncbi:MAG: VanZ family protein, partial [Elusimicrobiota bacterium]